MGDLLDLKAPRLFAFEEESLVSFFNLRCGREMTLVVDNSQPAAAPRPAYRRRTRRRFTRFRRPIYRRKARRVVRRRRVRRRVLPKFVRAQINPFDVNVDGVKIPDSNTIQSTPLKIEDQFNGVATDANGLIALGFIPTLVNNRVGYSAVSASTWSWNAAFGGGQDSSRKTAVADNYNLFRPCAHGLRITCSAAPTTITGNLHVGIATTSNFGASTWTWPTSIADLANCQGYRKYPLAMLTQQGVNVVNKFLDCTATKYIDTLSDGYTATGTDITMQTNGWAAIIIAVEGAPVSTAVLSIAEVMHLEAIPKVSAVDNSTPAAPYDVNTLMETSRLSGNIAPTFSDAESARHEAEVHSLLGGMFSAFTESAARRASATANRFASSLGGFAADAAFAGANYWLNSQYLNRWGNPANASPAMLM